MAKKRKKKKSVKRASENSQKSIYSKEKLKLVVRNLILFSFMFLVFLFLYKISSNEMYVNLFLLLSIIFGFVGVAFLIILIIFGIMRLSKK